MNYGEAGSSYSSGEVMWRSDNLSQSSQAGREVKRAFTLVELLVVVGIIAVLIAVLMPALTTARNQAKLMICQSNLRQFGVAMQVYATINRGCVPLFYNKTLSSANFSYDQTYASYYIAYKNSGQPPAFSPNSAPVYLPLGAALFDGGVMKNLSPLRCPLQGHQRFDEASVVWPPRNQDDFIVSGFTTRPVSVYGIISGAGFQTIGYAIGDPTLDQREHPPYPRLTTLHGRVAMASDVLPRVWRNGLFPTIDSSHLAKNCSVLYSDFSVISVPAKVYIANYAYDPIVTSYADTKHTTLVGGYWYDFDHYR